ncbi:UPF0182 family protein [Aquihabitans daechungensis]|uniref:UPF0182 family membrane protein n=1 Tax=Aquihabitans daechungensis TaxID=1052257 RepID=UPI003BA2950D
MPPEDLPQPPPRPERKASARSGRPSVFAGRGRVFLGAFLAIAFIVLVSLRGIAGFYTDYLWFDSLNLGAVWSRVLTTKATLSIIGGVVFFTLCWGNLLIAERLAPVFRPSSGDDDLIERYHEMIGRRAWLVRLGVALFMALIIGVSLGASWNDWILFTNAVDFDQVDATFKKDIGFYVFQLPFLLSAASWLFSSLVVVFIITVLAHVVNGGIRFHTQLDRVTPQVKAHLSVLMALLALVQVGRYWLSRYELTFSTRGTVDGATYTDVNVELRAIYLLMLIALFAVGLFIANIWRRGWVLPGMAVGLWVLVAVLAGGVVPAFVQRFRVEPTESSMERPYIANNIKATQAAYKLDVTSSDLDWRAKSISAETMADNVGTLDNVRLWDPKSMQDRLIEDQEIQRFYAINDVDVDRYVIDGKMTQVMIAARDLAPAEIKQASWEATHLTYTHGYGVVAATANDQTASGTPVLKARDIPVKSDGSLEVDPESAAIYFGENKSGYVIVNTDRKEINFQDEDGKTSYTSYKGEDGVEVGSGVTGFLRKAAFSLRFGDVNPMVSGNIRPDSKILLERDVTSRLKAVAPFLAYDHDPYVVVVDGKVQYVLDGYTTTRHYPNAQRADTGGLDPTSGLYGRSFNYARNSVKAVVDAYDGTVTLYVVDDDDPLIKAYQKAFPELFSKDELPEDLQGHIRYPEDLFTVQTQMYAKYHVTDADDFYNGNDEWSVPRDSGATEKSGDTNTKVGPDGQELTSDDKYPSQYMLMQLPGEDEASFVLQRPYVTSTDDSDGGGGENQLRSLIVANSDYGADYGSLRVYKLPVSDLPDGPNIAAADILANGDVAAKVKDLCTDKRVCTFAAPSILPVGDSLLYVQSFLSAADKNNAAKIEYVIVNYRRPGDQSDVTLSTTLYGALEQLFGDKVPTSVQGGDEASASPGGNPDDPGETDPTGTLSEQESKLIDRLVKAFADADAAARKGDQVTYAEKITEAAGLAEDLQKLRDEAEADTVEDGETTTTTTAPTATTTTEPTTTTTTTAGA